MGTAKPSAPAKQQPLRSPIPTIYSGTTYTWTLPVQNSVTGSFTATNTTATAINDRIYLLSDNPGLAIYSITPSANGCTGTATTVNVTVNPIPSPSAAPILSANICGPKTLSFTGTPPHGTSWYWQGTNPAGQDNMSPTATSPTYSATPNGANTYYLASKNTYGCWNGGNPVTVTVDSPPAPTLWYNSSLFTFCEDDVMAMVPIVYPSFANIRWYSATNQLLATGIYTPVNMGPGTYTYNLKNYSANGCESATSTPLTLQVGGPTANCDKNINWQESIAYTYNNATDPMPVVATDNKVYSDGFWQNQFRHKHSPLPAARCLPAKAFMTNSGTNP